MLHTFTLFVFTLNKQTNMDLLSKKNPIGDLQSRHYLQYCGEKEWLPLVFLSSPETNKTSHRTWSESSFDLCDINVSHSVTTDVCRCESCDAEGYRCELNVDGVIGGQLALQRNQLCAVPTLRCLNHVLHVEHPRLSAVRQNHHTKVRKPGRPKTGSLYYSHKISFYFKLGPCEIFLVSLSWWQQRKNEYFLWNLSL